MKKPAPKKPVKKYEDGGATKAKMPPAITSHAMGFTGKNTVPPRPAPKSPNSPITMPAAKGGEKFTPVQTSLRKNAPSKPSTRAPVATSVSASPDLRSIASTRPSPKSPITMPAAKGGEKFTPVKNPIRAKIEAAKAKMPAKPAPKQEAPAPKPVTPAAKAPAKPAAKPSEYKVYNKKSAQAAEFRRKFNEAKEGAIFDFEGRKYVKRSKK